MTRASLPLLVVLAACGTTDLDDDATHTTDPEPAPLEGPAVDGPALEEPPGDVPHGDAMPPDEPAPDVDPQLGCAAAARAAAPSTCPFANELVVYGQEGWNVLADELAPALSPCTQAFISIPPRNDDKTQVREGQAALMRARGPQLHPMAEFHFTTWNRLRLAEGLTWRELGMRFREEMEREGYCVEAGDTWAINEAPSTLRKDAAFRAGFAELLGGLSEGRAGMPFSKGAVFIVGFGHKSTNLPVYKGNVKRALQDAGFWAAANKAVRFWGQEVYVDPQHACVSGATAAERRAMVNRYAMHQHRLSAVAPDVAGANTAQSFLGRAYVPVLNAVWDAAPERGYGDTTVSLAQMRRFVRAQVEAVRSYAAANAAPDGRIGFAFASYHDPQEWAALGATIGDALACAYGEGGVAADACGIDGCACVAVGATANPAWDAFSSW
ncbi:MAG: hypothetical protein A2138_24465 [Deltaproteobacteria bacterium RBG_16_71_12]|nr:MAG: hypothetical protein A2138_24465 [Deltaproteobacteria bacterium RBG_16_71_12]